MADKGSPGVPPGDGPTAAAVESFLMDGTAGGGQETKVIYHIDDETTPYLVKIPMPSATVTLRDFKVVLNKQNANYKYFFKSMDADFGVVKEEIVDDSTILPCFNGRVVSWLVSADGSNISDNCSEVQPGSSGGAHGENHNFRTNQRLSGGRTGPIGGAGPGRPSVAPSLTYQSASVLSSDLDSTSMFETESEVTFDRGDMTECSSVQRLQVRKKPQRRKKRPPSLSRTSSYSSITDSTMSLNIITVSINMDSGSGANFLGISIVGQSNRGGDGGIYVGSIMKGGAVALDGRIEPGDMILQVNEVNFENMTNDEAVRVLRDVVQKPGPIKLVVAKCWDPNPKGYFTIPRTEPVRPIDPGAWVAHTQAIRNCPSGSNPNLLIHENQSQISGSSTMKGLPGHAGAIKEYYRSQGVCGMPNVGGGSPLHSHMYAVGGPGSMASGASAIGLLSSGLSIKSSLKDICRRMFSPDSGLEIRDRMWLKITIPNAFIGADCVNWIQENVAGVEDRREARRIVSSMLRNNYIKHTVNKLSFSEQCYYALGQQGIALMNEAEQDANIAIYNGGDTDSLLSDIGPLPNPPIYMPPYSGAYQPPTLHGDNGYQPIHYGLGGRMSSGSSSSTCDVLTSKDMSASQSDITSIIHQAGHITIGGSNKSSGSSRGGGGGGGGGNKSNGQDELQLHGMFV